MSKKSTNCYAVVNMFNKYRECIVEAYGEPQNNYEKNSVLWVERGEDMYAQPHYKEPYCILTRENWLNGTDVISFLRNDTKNNDHN